MLRLTRFALLLGVIAVFAVTAAAALAATQRTDACGPLAKWRAVFPPAAATDFAARWPITYHSGKRNHWQGTCGGWAATYTDYRGSDRTQEALSPTRDFAQVSIVVLTSRAAARAAYEQTLPSGAPSATLPSGPLMRSGVYVANRDGRQDGETATVVSLVRNIVVISNGEGRPADKNGAKARREQERLHRAIHRNVLALG